jgi:uncharacterized protein (TIGR02996 family)
MTDHEAFLTAIAADPRDRATRLIYADWLEEQGDARCELIRIEDDLRTLPPTDDRFWQAKQRRNRLRRRAPADWLAALRYAYPAPIFVHGWPDDVPGRWRLIREYVERWRGVVLPDGGGHRAAVVGIEARLGTLSPSVREWIAFAFDVMHARRIDPHNAAQERRVLDDVYRMEELPAQDAISLFSNATFNWIVRRADLGEADPPAFGRFLDNNEPAAWHESISKHASVSELVLERAIATTRSPGGEFRGPTYGNLEIFRRRLALYFPIHCRLPERELFEGRNLFVHLVPTGDNRARIEVKASSQVPLETIPGFLREQSRYATMASGMFAARGRAMEPAS